MSIMNMNIMNMKIMNINILKINRNVIIRNIRNMERDTDTDTDMDMDMEIIGYAKCRNAETSGMKPITGMKKIEGRLNL
jgi:hypothetical protein